jgi:hypothetical protein
MPKTGMFRCVPSTPTSTPAWVPHCRGDGLHRLQHVAAARHDGYRLDAKELIQEVVAPRCRVEATCDALF